MLQVSRAMIPLLALPLLGLPEGTDVVAVVAAAERHGGRVQDRTEPVDSRMHAAVRDPDGNTIEVYGPH